MVVLKADRPQESMRTFIGLATLRADYLFPERKLDTDRDDDDIITTVDHFLQVKILEIHTNL